jgi:bacillithiol biosynthesis cysteine-adding enzyme BshC
MSEASRISLSSFLPLSPSLEALRNRDASLLPLVSHFCDKEALVRAAAEKQFFPHRQVLTQALLEQYAGIANNETAIHQIKRLLDPAVCTVTTGHQVCFAGGPLYVFIKVAQTIAFSKYLEAEAGLQVVPVLWMATEDHDLAEISELNLFGKKVPLPPQAENNKVPVGRLDASVLQSLLEAVCDPQLRIEERITSLLSDCYKKGNSLSKAFRSLMHQMFGRQGLVVLDADDASLKRLFVPLMERELKEGLTRVCVEKTVTSKAYEQWLGKGVMQAKPRGINLFYLQNQLRLKIEKEDMGYVSETGERILQESLLSELHSHPENFSPGALLRPLYQEYILPNLAYIGGAAEIKYWLQLSDLFAATGIQMPALLLRNSFFFLEKNHWEKWKLQGFDAADIFLSAEQLTRRMAEKAAQGFSTDAYLHSTEELYSRLLQEVSRIDAGMAGAVEAEKVKQLSALKNLEARVLRSVKQKEESVIRQVIKTKEVLFPEGAYRERSEAGILRWFDTRAEVPSLLTEVGSSTGFGGSLVIL